MSKKIKIAGAGIAGLTAAINLADAGYEVIIFDKEKDSGFRFSGDMQGIENWAYQNDALDLFNELNIEPDFNYTKSDNLSIWTSKKKRNDFEFKRPLFYLIERGTAEGTLDQSLKRQALEKGVKIEYGVTVSEDDVDIVATGPNLKNSKMIALASGYTFETNLSNYFSTIISDEYARNGYSYLLVDKNGKGTIASCIFGDFKNIEDYREKTVEFFQEKTSLEMKNKELFSGTGNFFLPDLEEGGAIHIGEAGGFQDYLWGFGIKYALLSGCYAARSIIDKEDFYQLCREDIYQKMKASVVNRSAFQIFNNNVCKVLLNNHKKIIKDNIKFAKRVYRFTPFKKTLFPLSKIILSKKIKDPRNL